MAEQNAKLAINIAAEFVGKAAFSQASKAVGLLDKNVTRLGKAIVGVFAAQKLMAYSKTAIVAYKDDALAAKALTQTLDNLGLAFEDSRAKTLISNLEQQYKIADDYLRPALGKLLQITGSLNMSQNILKTALDASAGSGTDLGTTIQDLSQAYVGNLRGLRKYNLGLTQAELQTKSFSQIQELLNNKFKDQALLKAADPLNALDLAANNAKETIGKGLVDAINSAVGAGTGVNDITTNVNALATSVSKVISGLGAIAGFFTYGIKGLAKSGKETLDFLGLTGSGKYVQMPKGQYTKGGGKAVDLANAARKKAEQEAIKRNKELLALTQKQAIAAAAAAKAKKEAAILDKVGLLFNMDLIENIAALQGKITKDEELRLKTQQALLTGNAESAGTLAMKLLEAQKAAMLARAADPFLGWTDSAAAAIKAINEMIAALIALGVASAAAAGKTYKPTIATSAGTYYMSSTGVSSLSPDIGTSYDYFSGLSGGKYGSTPTYTPQMEIVVSVDPNNGNINASTQNTSLNGTTTTATRINSISGGL